MLQTCLSAIMAIFLSVGAIDKAFFHSRYGYGKAFDEGLNTMGPLTLLMVGIMCVAPPLGEALLSTLAPLFDTWGADPALIAGLFFPVDAGGLALAKSLAQSQTSLLMFGIGLCSTLACIVTLPLPFSLAIVSPEARPLVAKGIVAGVIASPFGMLVIWIVALIAEPNTLGFFPVLRLAAPALVLALLLAVALTVAQRLTIRFFLWLGDAMMALYTVLLMLVALSHFFSINLIPGIAPIAPQLSIVGEISLMLAGAYPLVHFVKTHGQRGLKRLGARLNTDSLAALGMVVSLANPLPMYSMLEKMSARGKVLASAFAGPALCTFGDHAAFMSAYYPEGLPYLLVGKLGAALLALGLAMLLEIVHPSTEPRVGKSEEDASVRV